MGGSVVPGELFHKGILYQQGEVYVLRNTMPFPLRENNAFIAESDKGWAVIDTGVNTRENQQRWTAALKEIGISFHHIQKIYVTHYHHDHLGLAGWLQEKSQAQVLLPPPDLHTFQTFINGDQYGSAIRNQCFQAGWNQVLTETLAEDVNSIDILIQPYPFLTALSPDTSFNLGGDLYTTYPVPGHSDGHYVFVGVDNGWLFGGDNLIKHTILHLTDWPHTRLVNPLADHLAALDDLRKLDISLVLPGHGMCFSNILDRIDVIQQHHEKRKNQVLQGLIDSSSAWDLAVQLFRDNPYIHIKRLILAETLAYLNALVGQQQIAVEERAGVNYYRRVL